MIVSCTTLPSRCEHVVETARSIFRGAVVPEKFVLNLFRGDFNGEIPAFIADYAKEEKRFEVYFSDTNYYSATKLIPTLKRFPDETVVIVDEDKEYQPTVLENLVKQHEKHPKCAICMKGELIRQTIAGNEILYYGFGSEEEDPYIIPAGGSGVLFPAHAFDDTDVENMDLFLKWQKPQDDRWWWMNYTKNGIKAIGAVKYVSDSQFSLKDFETKDTIHSYLWVPENIRRLDKQFFEWMKIRYPLLYLNIPKMKYVGLGKTTDGRVILQDEFGFRRRIA